MESKENSGGWGEFFSRPGEAHGGDECEGKAWFPGGGLAAVGADSAAPTALVGKSRPTPCRPPTAARRPRRRTASSLRRRPRSMPATTQKMVAIPPKYKNPD